jgi:hypothetical protein
MIVHETNETVSRKAIQEPFITYKKRWKVMPPIFFLRKYNYSFNERYIPYKVEIIFPQHLLNYQDTFSTFA